MTYTPADEGAAAAARDNVAACKLNELIELRELLASRDDYTITDWDCRLATGILTLVDVVGTLSEVVEDQAQEIAELRKWVGEIAGGNRARIEALEAKSL